MAHCVSTLFYFQLYYKNIDNKFGPIRPIETSYENHVTIFDTARIEDFCYGNYFFIKML